MTTVRAHWTAALLLLVVSTSGQLVSAQPTFTRFSFDGKNPEAIAIADLTGDGWPDIVFSDTFVLPGGFFVQQSLVNNTFGGFVFTQSGPSSNPSAAHFGITVGSFNSSEDAIPDLVLPNTSPAFPGYTAITVMIGNGDGTFTFRSFFYPTSVSLPFGITSGDFDGDGNRDVAVAGFGSRNASIVRGLGNGTFASPSVFGVGSMPMAITAADFDQDNNLDLALALAGADSVAVFLGTGSGTVNTTPFTIAVGDSPVAIVTADFDNDGHPDLATANYKSNSVSVLLGDGTGQMVPALGSPVGVGQGPSSIASGNFDLDAQTDLVTGNRIAHSITVLSNSGADFSIRPTGTYAVPTPPKGVASGDLNLDGRPDISVSCDSTGGPDSIMVFFNTSATVSVREPDLHRASLGLLQSRPNPARSASAIEYYLPTPTRVSLEVFALSGQRVRTLVDQEQAAGRQQAPWDLRDVLGGRVLPGMYFYRLTTKDGVATHRCVVLE